MLHPLVLTWFLRVRRAMLYDSQSFLSSSFILHIYVPRVKLPERLRNVLSRESLKFKSLDCLRWSLFALKLNYKSSWKPKLKVLLVVMFDDKCKDRILIQMGVSADDDVKSSQADVIRERCSLNDIQRPELTRKLCFNLCQEVVVLRRKRK